MALTNGKHARRDHYGMLPAKSKIRFCRLVNTYLLADWFNPLVSEYSLFPYHSQLLMIMGKAPKGPSHLVRVITTPNQLTGLKCTGKQYPSQPQGYSVFS